MRIDPDLLAIQDMRDLVAGAASAQQELKTFSQEKVDQIVKAMAEAGEGASEWLAKHAVEETGLGVWQDKVVKNLLATRGVYGFIKDLKTVGVTYRFPEKKVIEIAEPVGVIAALTPTTNPTSTAMYKCLISIKARNGIVVSPHPRAARCTSEAVDAMHRAAVKASAPEGIIGCLRSPTLQATHELMRHDSIALILATGGSDMVRAAYSSGKPAYGVGPGNVPAYIERSADVARAVEHIVISKTFDNGTICASEQAVIVDQCIRDRAADELHKRGAYFLSGSEIEAVSRVVIDPSGVVNPRVVGQPATRIAQMAGVTVPDDVRLLVAELEGVGRDYPLSREKLSPVLAFYSVPDWEKACEICIEMLRFGGIGHTMVIHSRDDAVIMEFATKKPAFRILVNTPASHGAVGATTGLDPALTLGCGTWGGSATADNIGPLHLLNIKRVAYGLREPEGYRPPACPPCQPAGGQAAALDIEEIVREVVRRLGKTQGEGM
ncbi:MAG: acetaldehyde dehydrogenase (acetylating) [Firmicutes bacterium]|nr:acetaldehyde dehydrogenase (acetylating) [Bacillota bacterium]